MDAYDTALVTGVDDARLEIDPAVLPGITVELARTAAFHDRSGAFPHDNIALLRRHGIIGLQAARDIAGQPLDLAQARRVVAAIALGEPSTALVLIMTWLFSLQTARNPHWPPALRAHVLRDIAVGGALANALRVEPALGTPVRGGLPETTARRVPGGWRLTGRKLYSTGIPGLRWLGVWGRTDDADPLVGTFLVSSNAEGFHVEETWDQLGMRATGSHDAVFEDVFIPAENAVDIRQPAAWAAERAPELNQWMSVLLSTLYDAVAQNARDWLVRFVSERTPSNLGAPLSSLPRFQEAIGELDTLLHINVALLDRSTFAGSAELAPLDGSYLKHIVTNNAIRITERAISLAGNPALSRANPLERHYRDALFGRVHSPQDDTILTNAGKAAFAAYAARNAETIF